MIEKKMPQPQSHTVYLMVAYLTNTRFWLQWKRNERLCKLGGLEHTLNPYAQLDAILHPGMDPELVSSLIDEYSVTQLPPGDYYYGK